MVRVPLADEIFPQNGLDEIGVEEITEELVQVFRVEFVGFSESISCRDANGVYFDFSMVDEF